MSEWMIDTNARVKGHAAGVIALVEGLQKFTDECASEWADPLAADELQPMFSAARFILNYAPETLRRGAIDHAFAEMMRAWNIDPDTDEYTGW